MSKSFLSVNFGCRVNSAETNQWSQTLINQGFTPSTTSDLPSIIFVNTCSITKKGEIESLSKVRILHQKYPKAKIYVTGCANLEKLKDIPNVFIYKNDQKEELLNNLNSSYTPKIKDKFSHTNRFLLKIQSGCTQFCSYCIVPQKRPNLWSLTMEDAIKTVNSAITDKYKEIIITGVNLNQYQFGLSNLVEKILKETDIKLISFGSVPLNCIDQKFIDLLKEYPNRLSNFLHIPIQSGSDKILKLMNRPYTQKDILNKIRNLKLEIRSLKLGTDIIVGFPTETDQDFEETLDICQKIGFKKIHCFKYSSRPNTKAKIIYESNPKIDKKTLSARSQQIRNLN
ncbi:MAG: MiaB/RimO family radical SAM methylthiotransferase [Candidatus Shapirobacteria bacterium]